MVLCPCLDGSLVQFWAPTKTSEGRTLLTNRYQPFALGSTPAFNKSSIEHLCEYRMKMCREHNFFYADAESGEEQFGLPGRVFLHKLPECTPDVQYYSLKEYPQRDLALRCYIRSSWGLPVFESSSRICVGVLEISSLPVLPKSGYSILYLGHLFDTGIFQEFGLQCFEGCKDCEMQEEDENKAAVAFTELETVLESVCKIHKLPLAMTWVPCRTYGNLWRCHYLSRGEGLGFNESLFFQRFKEKLKRFHLRKGQVTRRILPFPNLLYCSDVKQLSIAEYPLVAYARQLKLSGWFTICLQSNYSGSELYMLEFFLPASNEDNDDILTRLSLILRTMEENFKTFKLASCQELGKVLSVEVIDFPNGQKSHSIQIIEATRFFPGLELLKDGGGMLQLGQPSMDAVNSGMNVVGGAQNYNLPSFEPLQNGNVVMELDSSDQLSMNPSNNGQNVVTTKRNIIVGKTQERKRSKAGVKIEVSLEDILKYSKMSRDNAARKLEVSVSTLKRLCRGHGIHRWPPRNMKKVHSSHPLHVENQELAPQIISDLPSNQASASVVHINPAFQDADLVTIRAKYETNTIKFRLSLSSRFAELQQEVAKRLNLEAGSYYVKYKDEVELILIACDEDLQDCARNLRSVGNTSIVVQLEPKQTSQLGVGHTHVIRSNGLDP